MTAKTHRYTIFLASTCFHFWMTMTSVSIKSNFSASVTVTIFYIKQLRILWVPLRGVLSESALYITAWRRWKRWKSWLWLYVCVCEQVCECLMSGRFGRCGLGGRSGLRCVRGWLLVLEHWWVQYVVIRMKSHRENDTRILRPDESVRIDRLDKILF